MKDKAHIDAKPKINEDLLIKMLQRYSADVMRSCLKIIDARLMGRDVEITDDGKIIITTTPEGFVRPDWADEITSKTKIK